MKIELKGLSAGMYFLSLVGDRVETITQKIVVR